MTHLIHIGNSLGIRIPKAIISQVGFHEDMTLLFKVTKEGLLIVPKKSCREGWEEAFNEFDESKEGEMLMRENSLTKFDDEGWEW